MNTSSCIPGLVLAALCLPSVAGAQTTVRVNVTSAGLPANGGLSAPAHPKMVISSDGYAVAFVSTAYNLGNTDFNLDLFVHDRSTGVTEMVSGTPAGLEGDGYAIWPSLSFDGRYAAFHGTSTNIAPGDTTNDPDVFVHDRLTGTTELISQSGGTGNAVGTRPTLSHDGRYVAFLGGAAFHNGQWVGGVCVYDRQTGTTALASVHENGSAALGTLYDPFLSGDGRYVAFSTLQPLVAGDTNAKKDVYVRDMLTKTTMLASVSSTGALGDYDSHSAHGAFSADGQYVAFSSQATTLVPADTNNAQDIFVRDLLAGTTVRASVSSAGVQGDGNSHYPRLTSDGTRVVFESWASNLVPGDPGFMDTFLHDLTTGTTELVGLTHTGVQAPSSFPSISGDGRFAAFAGGGNSGFVPGPAGTADLEPYVRDRTGPSPVIATYCSAKWNSQSCLPAMGATGVPTAAGATDAFRVWALNMLSNKTGLVFWSRSPASTPLFGGTKCVGNPVLRTPGQNSGGFFPPTDCSGTYSFHFSQAYMALRGLIPGTTVHCQVWQRDPGLGPPSPYGLSDGVSFTVVP